jgi:hypothetical protein
LNSELTSCKRGKCREKQQQTEKKEEKTYNPVGGSPTSELLFPTCLMINGWSSEFFIYLPEIQSYFIPKNVNIEALLAIYVHYRP